MSLSIQIDTKAVNEALQKLEESLRGQTFRDGMLEGAFHAEGIAKTKAPVDTGFLRSSIQAQSVSDSEARVAVGAEYSIHVEYGTHKMIAQPFIRPTVDNHGAEIANVILNHIRNAAGLR